ncbi:hypothetical protein FA95DRAFT_1424240 [Auriscalpium vulgare]|uniref:Uncharacterized protein n=1 Tax=Auriscalpium vulgare TaxID=40419 RepID=A0ACB8RPI5_9AGAM|nr:hypothetical protein FA95DRAFT_1424240 [Auriscalpium vulgare]
MLRSHPREELEQIREEVLNTDEVTLRFDRWEIDALWERARADAGDGAVGAGELAVEKVTRHDALIAYLVTLHNRCSGEAPIHTVLHLMNVRLHQPPADTAQHLLHRHPDVVGNGSQIPSIPLHNKRRNDALVGGERGAWFSESLYEVAEGAAAWPAWVDSAAPSPVAAEGACSPKQL